MIWRAFSSVCMVHVSLSAADHHELGSAMFIRLTSPCLISNNDTRRCIADADGTDSDIVSVGADVN